MPVKPERCENCMEDAVFTGYLVNHYFNCSIAQVTYCRACLQILPEDDYEEQKIREFDPNEVELSRLEDASA